MVRLLWATVKGPDATAVCRCQVHTNQEKGEGPEGHTGLGKL